MKWGFVLVTLYMGPIGLLLYVMADKEPAPGTPSGDWWARMEPIFSLELAGDATPTPQPARRS